MAYLMTGGEYAQKALDIAYNYLTAYANGTYGQPKSDSLIDSCASRLKWYTAENIATLKALSNDYFLFDCSGLVKGIGWGFPNVVYGSNDVPDHNDAGFWNDCGNTQSTDWTNIEVGELLHMNGHVGIYIGDGKGVECTPGFGGLTPGLKITAVGNIGKINGFPTRTWTGHGKLPWIEYVNSSAPSSPTPVEPYTPNPTPPMPSAPTVTDELTKFSVKIFPSSYVFGDKIEGMATEWDDTKTEQENIYKFLEYVNPNIRYKLKDEFDNIVDWFHYVASRSYGLTDSEWTYYYLTDKGVTFNIGDYVSDVYFDLETSKWSPPMTYDATYWYSLFLYYGNGRFCSPINWSYNPALVYNKESNIIPIRSYSEHSSGYTDNPDDVSTYLVAFWKREGNTIVYDKLYVLYNVTDPNAGLYKAWQYILLTDDLTNFDISYEPFNPGGDDDMKIETPNLLDLANRQYVCKRGDVFKIFEYISNLPSRAGLWNDIKAVLGEYYTDWASVPMDVQIFPLVFKTNSGNTQHFVNPNALNPVRYVYMAPALVPQTEGILCDFDPDNIGHRIYEIQNSRDVLVEATDWIQITRKNNDFTDFAPYCSTKLYLPYVGYVDFDLTIYYGKYIKIKYAVDISNGGCVAFVCIANSSSVTDDGRVVAKFEGSMGVHNPFELTSWDDYYNSVRSTLADSAGMIATTAGFGFAGLGTAISNSKIRKANRAELNAMGGMIDDADYINRGTSKVNLSNFNTDVKADQLMNTPNVRSTSSGSCLSGCLNAYGVVDCYMMFYYTITEETTKLQAMRGYPSNKSGKLSEFTGFLQCSDVKLVCPRATESEKTRLVQLLTSGIYI